MVYFRDSAGGRTLGIDQTRRPAPDPVADWIVSRVGGAVCQDRAHLAEALKAGGLDGNALLETADATRYGERLAENTETAAQRGVFGSPTFIVGDDAFFGNDRLEFLEQALQR